ncbi:MAG TPA: hypothetical protein ENH78_07740 [Phycisphaerae bacterium]|nr:hypothetical protein [Phycisphaerae bacterium]
MDVQLALYGRKGLHMLNVRLSMACLLLVAGCQGRDEPVTTVVPRRFGEEVLIDPSASGWDVRLGVAGQTVLISPGGRTYDVGKTQYPDIVRARLHRFPVEELKAEFLALYMPPAASGPSTLTLFTIRAGDTPVRAADIRHHWEPHNVRDWKATLFTDSDGDGVLELRDNDAYRWGGTVTYYAFDGQRFSPLWIEEYKAPEDKDYDLKLISRRRAQ